MKDGKIVSLFMERDERAIVETQHKYGSYCLFIARSILDDEEDPARPSRTLDIEVIAFLFLLLSGLFVFSWRDEIPTCT